MTSLSGESSRAEHDSLDVSTAEPTQRVKQKHPAEVAQDHSFSYSILVSILLDAFSIGFGIVSFIVLCMCIRSQPLAIRDIYKLTALSAQYILTFVLFGRIHFLYSHSHSLLQVRETAGILRVSVYSLALIATELVFSNVRPISGLVLLSVWVLSTLTVLFQKHLTRSMLAKWKAQHPAEKRVLILGTNSEARRVFSFLLNSPDLQLSPVAFCQEQIGESRVIYSHDYSFRNHAPVYPQQLNGELLAELQVTHLFVADPTISPQRLDEIRLLAFKQGVELSFVGSTHLAFSGGVSVLRVMDGLLISSVPLSNDYRGTYEACKRVIDVAGALLILSITAPVWIVIAVLIKTTSEGPCLFRQERIGKNGAPFLMYKFRSMYVNAPKYDRSPEDTNDPRITQVGRLIRKTSLDELPQIMNVLKGEMTLVGPRPEMPYIVRQYDTRQAQRLSVKQGVTGIWQLSADRRHSIHESVEYDLYYIENRGVFLDVAILLHTLLFAMKGI